MGSNQEISNLSFSDINGTSHGGLHVSGKNFTRDLVSPMKSAMSKEDKTEEDSPIANESIEGHGEDEMFGYSPEGSQDGDYKTSNRTSPGQVVSGRKINAIPNKLEFKLLVPDWLILSKATCLAAILRLSLGVCFFNK